MEPTSRNARFDEIFDQLFHHSLNTEEFMKVFHELLPDPEERRAYSQYCFIQSQPHLANPAGILTPDRFIEIADRINFLNSTERKELLPGLTWDYRPWIPLGYEDTTFYRLLPSIHNLSPQNPEWPKTDYEVLDTAFLGVNTTVQPREPSQPLSRRALNLSEQSTQSAESDDADAPGFVFHELGELQCLECDTFSEMPTTYEEGKNCRGNWRPTGFHVVARLGDFGHMNGVYVIFNMQPDDEVTGLPRQITDSEWGIPPSSPEAQFSCAKIGRALRDFGFGKRLAWNEQIQHPVELVWAVRSSTGSAMRVTVDSNYKTRS
ncbi:hypothetical protein TGAM01_v210900 [Trichoderma gamsii]|uniref:Uncharacterized protein n=1 Tax=Trichoderma gamsii TaxID=398673 RepID=A0A2P4Z7G7_9HYPO|nr:hypothetical protein TGAM01_v210900 [Trichoderma gamsii]PON20216.1 hypothetical protein TGAM01_v210900 [Trichoderma gamsii]